MNKFNETLSNLQAAMESMPSMQNLANVMSAIQTQANISPNVMKPMRMAQIAMSAPAYQALIRQQEILNKMVIPSVLITEFQVAINFVQPALQNMNLSGFNNLMQSKNFLNSALVVQNASIDFLTEMKKLDNYQQKTLVEILKELRLKKNAEVELPEDFPTKLKKSFKNLFESVKNLAQSDKDFIKFVAEVIVHQNTTSECSFICYLSAFLLGLSALSIKRDENFGEQK